MKQGPLTLTQDDYSALCAAVKSHIYCEATHTHTHTLNINSTDGAGGNDLLHNCQETCGFHKQRHQYMQTTVLLQSLDTELRANS
jgi:hypothetical protein